MLQCYRGPIRGYRDADVRGKIIGMRDSEGKVIGIYRYGMVKEKL